MKKNIFLFMLSLFASTSFAYDFKVDGIYYNLKDGHAVVTHNGKTGCYQESVRVPEKVTYEGKTYVVTEIGDDAFSNSFFVEEMSIPSTITRIGKKGFYHCGGGGPTTLSCQLPAGLESIGDSAFARCQLLERELVLPPAIKDVPIGAFRETSITSCTLPEGIAEIGDYAFSGCGSLASVVLQEGVTMIGHQSFALCSKLKEINVPSSLVKIDKEAFKNTHITKVDVANLEMLLFTDILRYIQQDLCALTLYHNGERVEQVIIPEEMTIIPDRLFDKIEISSVVLHDRVTSIGEYAFSYSRLEEISIPTSVKSIGRYAFESEKFENIKIPDGIEEIADGLFRACHNLKNVELPESITKIGEEAFFLCGSLENITLPPNLQEIGREGLSSTLLASIEFPSSLKTLGDKAFANNLNLKRVEIPMNVTNIGEGAFSNCRYLEEVVLPEGMTTISKSMFHSCYRLKSIKWPSTLNTIDEYALASCGFNEVEIPYGVRTVYDFAFHLCEGLTRLVIPATTTQLAPHAFEFCKKLADVYNYATTPQNMSFGSPFTTYGTLHVVKGCKEAYESDKIWSKFTIVDDIVIPEGIQIPFVETSTSSDIFFIDGRRVKNVQHGINIENGHKVMRLRRE